MTKKQFPLVFYSKLISWYIIGLCLLAYVRVEAQTSISVDGQGHYNITSYNGYQTIKNRNHKIQIQLQGTNLIHRNWTITARINNPMISNVPNVSGLPFPTEKIKFRFTEEEITGNPPLPLPTLANVGANLSAIPFQQPGLESQLIKNSPAPLQTGSRSHINVRYFFAIDVEGGRYLETMLSENGGKPWNTNPALYQTTVTFTLYDENQIPIASHNLPLNIQVHRPLGDVPPEESEFSLSVVGQARNGTLVFNNAVDYVEGATVRYEDAIQVNAKTDYEISVKSLQEDFVGIGNQILPVNLVHVKLHAGSYVNGTVNLHDINLSTVAQAIALSQNRNNGKDTQFFSLEYRIQGGEQRIYQAKSGSYSTTVLYLLSPR